MENTVHQTTNGAGHEHREVSVRLIALSLLFLAIATFCVFVLVVGIFRYFYDTYSAAEAAKLSQPVIPPAPRLEVAPYLQLQDLHAKEDHVLSTYAWVNKQTGTVRIPVDRAIDLLAAKGLPSHNYLDDILAGRKPTGLAKSETGAAQQGTSPTEAAAPAATGNLPAEKSVRPTEQRPRNAK